MGQESAASLVKTQKNSSNAREAGPHSEEKTRLMMNRKSPASRYHRASLGSYCDGDGSRRSSSGKLNSPNYVQDAIPRYLRASTGSCHDFCKYGRKHAVEEKPWRPLSKRTTKPSSDQLILGKSSDPLERKMLKVKCGFPHDTGAHSKEDASDAPEIIKHEVPLPSKKVGVPLEQELESGRKMHQIPKMEGKSNNMSAKRSPVAETEALRVKSLPSSDASEGKIGKGRRSSNIEDSKTVVVSSDGSEGKIGKGRRSSNIEDGKTVVVSKASVKKVLRPANLSSSSGPSTTETINLRSRKNRNLKLFSPLKDQKRTQKANSVKPKNEGVPEKILHVIKTETVNSPPQSILKGDEVVEEDEETVKEEHKTQCVNSETNKLITKSKVSPNMKEKKVVEGNHCITLKKVGGVVSKDNDSSPLKLKFRRGKVVELQPVNNSARKLRFRRARLSLGNLDGADVRRSFKKKELVDDKNGLSPSTGKVVLRHQDVKDKKDTQVLLNNVIEETVSKLVGSRKSKVKALVGAFETVISRHDHKPTSQAVN